MREFFHGWRRKVGCITLVMALAFVAGWIRSRVVGDSLVIPSIRSVVGLSSERERITWQRLWYVDGGDIAAHHTLHYNSWNLMPSENAREMDHDWRVEFLGFTFYSGTDIPAQLSSHLWRVPYWSITIPLTLLSAYLLLCKPRQTPKPADPGMGFSQRHKDTERDKNDPIDNSDLPSVSP